MARTPSGLALAAAAAQRFYVEKQSKVEIAAQLGVSRFKVARLLTEAQNAGLVRIQVLTPPTLDADLAEGLRSRFGVAAAFVLRLEDTTTLAARRAVAGFTAGLLEEVVSAEDVVGIAWGRTVALLTDQVHAPLRCRFVQLSGALPRADVHESAVELTRRLAAATQSTSSTFYAPLAVPDAATAEGLRSQSGISETLAELDTLTKAVVSIGAWLEGESTALDSLDATDRLALEKAGACAEITGTLYDRDGRVVDALADRVLGITAAQLQAVPDVIAMAVGERKVEGVAAALRTGMVSTIVTHASLARAVLEIPDHDG